MVIGQALEYGKVALKDRENINPLNESRYILSFLLDRDVSYIHAHLDEDLDKKTYKAFVDMVDQRAQGYPLQYLLGTEFFWGREYKVDPRALIPRPESELLVESCLEIISKLDRPRVLEIGSGSGALAISIGASSPKAQITSVDISKEALDLAKSNARDHGVTNVDFIWSDVYENVRKKYDIIISNPPYIDKNHMEDLQEEVRYEPRLALYGGEDGLDFYRRIIGGGKSYLKSPGYLLLELGYDQYGPVRDLLDDNDYEFLTYKKDLQGHIRLVGARFNL